MVFQCAKLIFIGYTGSKNPIQIRLKIQFVELDFSKKLVLATSSFFQTVFLILDNCDRSRQIEMMTLNDAEKRIEHCQEELNSKNG